MRLSKTITQWIFVDSDDSKKTETTDKILISLGTKSELPEANGIREHYLSSDGYIQMESLPCKIVFGGESERHIGIEMSYRTEI